MAKDTIARYKIQSEIGRGGMAAVYLAYDPNFRRNVAIKLVSVDLQENPIYRERFEREAQLIASIEHPAIVPVYDFGEQDNQLYLVMRYMPGGTLGNKIKQGSLTLRYTSQIISQIAPALDAVHAQGIIHRDLKPGNILLDSFGNPAISDFGIAHLTSAATDLTGNAIIGTPSYMSPEQVRGDGELDGRSDVYALGVILFEMLTGHGPFPATTPFSVALKHLTEPIPPIRSFRSDLPPEVELVLSKAMAKDREMRYSKASELALELSAILDTFQDKGAPLPHHVVSISAHEALSTEIDVNEDSQSAFRSAGAHPVDDSQFGSQSHADGSQKFPKTQDTSSESIDQPIKPVIHRNQPSRRNLQIAAIAGLGLFLFILCSSIGLFGALAKIGLPNFLKSSTPTAVSTLPANQADVSQGNILYSDDFSDQTTGWPTSQTAQGGYDYRSDGYHIFVNQTDQVFWATINSEFDNSNIHVDAKPISETANGYYGLLCRYQNDKNFYYFAIGNNGDYIIEKYINAEFQPLFPEGWRQSDAINQGNRSNRLEAECSGNVLRFYANNVLLDEVNDTDLSSGASGVIVGARDDQGFDVVFNNFLITKPGQ